MRIGVILEQWPNERRVSASPDTVGRLRGLGFEVTVQAGCGVGASFADAAYEAAGATLGDPLTADIVIGVRPFPVALAAGARPGQVWISHFWPAQRKDELQAWADAGVTLVAMDQVPRITRAQKLDALSSQANLIGYRSIVEAANHFGRFFPGQVTAAGKVLPAKVLVIGAGVAGLAAIGAARSLGAVVRAFDTRPIGEQIQSMGAEFLEVKMKEDGDGGGGYAREMSPAFIAAEMALFLEQAKEVDIIVTTALIPGKKAPLLVMAEAVRAMKKGSVVVDLAAESGGNCELTVPGEVADVDGVKIVGYTDLPSRMAEQASQLYGMNLWHLLDDMTRPQGAAASAEQANAFRVDMDDEVVRPMTVCHAGAVTWPPPPTAAKNPPQVVKPAVATSAAPAARVAKAPAKKKKSGHGHAAPSAPPSKAAMATLPVAALVLLALGPFLPADFLSHLMVFVLAVFIGFQVVWNVTPALHTPLMSVTNAISGIILVGGMVAITATPDDLLSPTTLVAALAILLAMINVGGGFLVTRRMLAMFRKEA
ncbi:MAG: Re/Si-specific NAD(P)(+) transhydrogenase subunit alpha [Myxococcales bacterium]|nr:Re/Si-specific NAD(P)(+) transhydrogenase subunit alpha [Myxococcales bacterium]